MTKAIILAIILLVLTIIICYCSYRFGKSFENRLGFIMIAAVSLTCSIALFGIREFPGERRQRAKLCLEEGYDLILDKHEVASGTIGEYLDSYVVLLINDNERVVYIKSTDESPFSMKD